MKLDRLFLKKASCNLSLDGYKHVSSPIYISKVQYVVPFDRQYILRMLVRTPESDGFCVPTELDWLKPTILNLDAIQKQNGLKNQFVYVTVRHGLVTSQTDDIWHVDGFSLRRHHLPEQNYIWTNREPTEYADQAFPIPSAFDPSKHHIHWYFDEQVEAENIRRCEEQTICLFDPYFVHRRPKNTIGMMRTFWRVSFIEIEIEDGQCQQNPLLPVKQYRGGDIRNSLCRFVIGAG
jgi:hypothetical protein